MGSEFSNANMTAPGLDDFTYTIVGEEEMNGKGCNKIESIPVNSEMEDQYGYIKSVSWVDKNSYLVYRIDYFDFDGDLFKTISNREFKLLDEPKGSYMVTNMHALNLSNERSSEMIMNQVEVTKSNPSYFTVAFLEK